MNSFTFKAGSALANAVLSTKHAVRSAYAASGDAQRSFVAGYKARSATPSVQLKLAATR